MLRTHGSLAVAVVIIVGTSAGLAQPVGDTAAPAQAEGQAAASPSSPRGSIVVVADLFPDETSNAHLRAGIYEAARQFAFSSQPRADVNAAAESVGALEAGQLSTDASALDRMRRTLSATLLIRVNKEWERGEKLAARVTVVAESGSKAQVVETPAADAGRAIAGAVVALLGQMYPEARKAGAPASQTSAQTSYLVNPGQPAPADSERPRGSAADRVAWQRRGGVIVSYEARALVTGLYRPNVRFSDINPETLETENGSAAQWGIGGGVGVRASLLFASLPDPVTGSGVWFAFRLGAGLDGSVLYTRPPVGFAYRESGRGVRRKDKVFFYPTGSIQIGPHFGLGEFQTPTIWRGVVLGVAYSPAVVWNLEIGETEFATDFNYAGVEATLDITSLEARQGIDRESQIRLFALLLPRVKEQPWLLSLGIGAVWY